MDTVERIFELVDEKYAEQKDFAAAIGVAPQRVSAWRTRSPGGDGLRAPVRAGPRARGHTRPRAGAGPRARPGDQPDRVHHPHRQQIPLRQQLQRRHLHRLHAGRGPGAEFDAL